MLACPGITGAGTDELQGFNGLVAQTELWLGPGFDDPLDRLALLKA